MQRDALEDRIHGDALAAANQVAEADRLALHQDQVDLGVGDTLGLDQVLDRTRRVEKHREGLLAPVGRQEVVQFLVEADLDGGFWHVGTTNSSATLTAATKGSALGPSAMYYLELG